MSMSLSGVKDLAGNVIPGTLSWSFVMQDFGVRDASVSVSGLKVNIPFSSIVNSSLVNSNITANITSTLSKLLGVPASRFANLQFSLASDGYNTSVSLSILPPSASSRRDSSIPATDVLALLKAILSDLSDGNSTLIDPSLQNFLSPDSQVYIKKSS